MPGSRSTVGTVGNAVGYRRQNSRLYDTLGGKLLQQLREINDGGRGMPFTAHFGLGNAANAELVSIEWPGIRGCAGIPLTCGQSNS